MRNLVLLINNYWKQQTENNKTQIMYFNWFENCDIMLEILNNLTHLDQSQTLITVMSSSFYFESFSLGHVYENSNIDILKSSFVVPKLL